MFGNCKTTQSYTDIDLTEINSVGEHEFPEPLEHWSVEDFEDVVPVGRRM